MFDVKVPSNVASKLLVDLGNWQSLLNKPEADVGVGGLLAYDVEEWIHWFGTQLEAARKEAHHVHEPIRFPEVEDWLVWAKCRVCNLTLGWWCAESEDHLCIYEDEYSCCVYCRRPALRAKDTSFPGVGDETVDMPELWS